MGCGVVCTLRSLRWEGEPRGLRVPPSTPCVRKRPVLRGAWGSRGPFAAEWKGQQLSPEGRWWRGWRTEPGRFGTPAVPSGLRCSLRPSGLGTNSPPLPPLAPQRAHLGCRRPECSSPSSRSEVPEPSVSPGSPAGTHFTQSLSDTRSPKGLEMLCLLGTDRAQRTQLHCARAKGTLLATQSLSFLSVFTRPY